MPKGKFKSTEDHIKDGTYRKCRHENRGISLDTVAEISVPDVLNKIASDKWEEIIPPLVAAGLVAPVDMPELTNAFVAYGVAQECLNYVNENFDSSAAYLAQINLCKGQVDMLKRYEECMDKYNRIMHKFGATPMERAKIKIQPKQEDAEDDLIKALSGNG